MDINKKEVYYKSKIQTLEPNNQVTNQGFI